MILKGLIDRIRFLFTGKLAPKEENILFETTKRFKAALNRMSNHYVSHKELERFKEIWLRVYKRLGIMWIPKRHPLHNDAVMLLKYYPDLDNIFEERNRSFIKEEKARFDSLFSDVDGRSLDDQQRTAVITSEDYNLVIAGAGSGKTLTISGKVKYLCEAKSVKPSDILLIAFTRKSAGEMEERIHGRMGIPIDAFTFHRLGLEIIAGAENRKPDVYSDIDGFIGKYLTHLVIKKPEEMKNLIQYFAYFLKLPAELEKYDSLGEAYDHERSADLETLSGKYERSKYIFENIENAKILRRTLKHEQVKSLDEVEIANFLFLNGIKYEYEAKYPFVSADAAHRSYHPDFFLPDYGLYIEHFGIDKNGDLPWLSPIEAEIYKEGMQWKREIHRVNGTCLLETYSYYSSEGRLLTELKRILKEKGVVFQEPDFKDIFMTIYKDVGERYFSEFITLCSTFITLLKSKGLSELEVLGLIKEEFSSNPYSRQRTKLFLDIIRPMLIEYDKMLAEEGMVDFSDMINKATKLIREGYSIHNYRWVIIDEFQDISMARYKLVKAILDQTGAKLMCVGDDWQSIYRFAGSDISLFTHFNEYFNNPSIMRIEKTYRNCQQLLDLAGDFVMKNPEQYRKELHSDISIEKPVQFYGYSEAPNVAIKEVLDIIINEFGKNGTLLFLGRTNFDLDILKSCDFLKVSSSGDKIVYKASPELNMSFLTVHKAKGLEADNVIILNFMNDTLGFPNKITDDPLLNLVLTTPDEFPYSEERRLLYVALTRSRKKTYVLVDADAPSEFLKEFQGKDEAMMDERFIENGTEYPCCPRCKTGHLLLRVNGQDNGEFLGCSNYPRCDYTLSDISVLKSGKKCPSCGGYLVIRHSGNGDFYGCTNYPKCRFTQEIDE